MSAFDSQEYMSRFGAALQGTQGGMQPSQVGGYGGYEGNSPPLGGAQDPGAIGSQTTAANDTAPSLVNPNMQARMLYRSQQRPQTPRPPPLGHETAGRPAQGSRRSAHCSGQCRSIKSSASSAQSTSGGLASGATPTAATAGPAAAHRPRLWPTGWSACATKP